MCGVFDHYWDFSVELMDQIDDSNAHLSICEVMHESKHKDTMFSKCISFHTKHSQQKKNYIWPPFAFNSIWQLQCRKEFGEFSCSQCTI